VLVSLDDWQWADQVSRFIVRTLPGRLIGLPVVWLFASRDDDAFADLAGSDPGSIDHIQLAPLTSADLAAIAQDRLGHAPDERTLSFLAAAAGNPLLATQIVDDLAQAAEPGNHDTVSLRFNTAISGHLAKLIEQARTWSAWWQQPADPCRCARRSTCWRPRGARGWTASLPKHVPPG
jgi:predicted ATPase